MTFDTADRIKHLRTLNITLTATTLIATFFAIDRRVYQDVYFRIQQMYVAQHVLSLLETDALPVGADQRTPQGIYYDVKVYGDSYRVDPGGGWQFRFDVVSKSGVNLAVFLGDEEFDTEQLDEQIRIRLYATGIDPTDIRSGFRKIRERWRDQKVALPLLGYAAFADPSLVAFPVMLLFLLSLVERQWRSLGRFVRVSDYPKFWIFFDTARSTKTEADHIDIPQAFSWRLSTVWAYSLQGLPLWAMAADAVCWYATRDSFSRYAIIALAAMKIPVAISSKRAAADVQNRIDEWSHAGGKEDLKKQAADSEPTSADYSEADKFED